MSNILYSFVFVYRFAYVAEYLCFLILNFIKDKKEDSCQRSESSGPVRRPFYNFLGVKEPDGVIEAATRDLNHGGREAGKGGPIDLSLKL